MVKINVVRIVEEEWTPKSDFPFFDSTESAAFEKIEITSTHVDENLQSASIWFRFKADKNAHEYNAVICTNENVWSTDFEEGFAAIAERFGVDEEALDGALLNFGEHVMGMYS